MAATQSCHWPLCEVHTLPKRKGAVTRVKELLPTRKQTSHAIPKAKILELPVELIEMIATHLHISSVLAFALSSQYIYQCIGDKTRKSLKNSQTPFAKIPTNEFLTLLQKDHPTYWHCTNCQILHRKRTTQCRTAGPSDLQIDIGLRTSGLLLPIPLSDIQAIQRYHLRLKDGLCPSILDCYGTARGRSGLYISYLTTARISSCQLLWHGVFHIDWAIPRADPTFFTRTPFQLCSHNQLIQNHLAVPSKKNNVQPFITPLPARPNHGVKLSPQSQAQICLCCPARLSGCAYCDTDFRVEYTEDIPNQRHFRIDIWKNFGSLGDEHFPRKDLDWHRASLFRSSPRPSEHWRDIPGDLFQILRVYKRNC